jgi:hypothetical protein
VKAYLSPYNRQVDYIYYLAHYTSAVKCTHSQNSCTSSPQQTGAYVPPPLRHHAPSDVLLVSRHLQLHLPSQVHAHTHGSSKPSVIISVFSATTKNQGFTLGTNDLLRRPPYLATRLEQFLTRECDSKHCKQFYILFGECFY